jgi:type II secretory pathway pseudopilin PulG
MCTTPRRRAARAGFTLVELMIVIGIIILLVALSAAAVLRFQNTGPFMATTTTINKLKAALDMQWSAVRDKAQRDPVPGSAGNPDTRLLYVNTQLGQAFPVSFTEVLFPGGGNSANQSYVNYLNSLGLNASNTTPADLKAVPDAVQQAICLMMALERGPSAGLTADQLTTIGAGPLTFTVKTSSGTKTFTANGCVDAWGRPLMFTRNAAGSSATKLIPEIRSMGADGVPGTADDIVSTNL